MWIVTSSTLHWVTRVLILAKSCSAVSFCSAVSYFVISTKFVTCSTALHIENILYMFPLNKVLKNLRKVNFGIMNLRVGTHCRTPYESAHSSSSRWWGCSKDGTWPTNGRGSRGRESSSSVADFLTSLRWSGGKSS